MAAKYSNTITTRSGTAIPDATVAVTNGLGALVELFSDAALSSSLGYSASADDEGLVEFYIADGTYTLTFTYGDVSKVLSNVELYDLSDLRTDADTNSTFKANATAVGITSSADDMGTFTGSTISDSGTAKEALQELETAHETLITDLASTASGKGAALVGFKSSLTGGTARTVQTKLEDTVSVKDFGAVGDGVTDDRGAIAAAVSGARGRQILFPEGNYLIDTDGGSITLEEVELSGENVLDGATGSIDQGVNLWITGTTNSPFLVRRGTTITGLGIYYPNQTDSAAPTAYPATLDFDYSNGAIQFVNIQRNVVYNAYKFIEMDDGTSGNLGHVEITDNYICALNRGIYLSHNLEHVRIARNNFTFGFWLAATEGGARAYMRANATAIQIDKTDGVKIFDNLFYGHLNAVLTSATGACQRVKFHSNEVDTVRYGFKATGTGRISASIIGNTFNSYNDQNTALQGRSISIETTGAGQEIIEITGNAFELATEDHIYTTDNTPTRIIVVGPNTYISWAHAKSSGTYGALNINGSLTSLNLTGGWMKGGNNTTYSYGVMGTFNVLECNAVNFEGCQRPLSVTLSYLAGSGNTSTGTGHTVSDVWSATTRVWGPNNFDKPQGGTQFTSTLLPSYADDTAASAGGVPVGGWYYSSGVGANKQRRS